MVLHELVDCALGGAWGDWVVVWIGDWLVFGGVQAAHEGSPIGLYDFGCAEVEELLDEDEHARAGGWVSQCCTGVFGTGRHLP